VVTRARLASLGVVHRRKLVALAGGVTFALATPPFDVYPAVFVGLGTYAWLMLDAPRPRDALALGWLWGAAASLVGLRFVPTVVDRFTPLGFAASLLALLLLAIGQGLTWGLGAGLGALARRRLDAPLELGCALATLLAIVLPAVIPWTPAGILAPWPALLQLAEAIGERGVSALMAAWSGAAVRGVLAMRTATPPDRLRAARPLFASLVAVALVLAHGTLTLERWSRPTGTTLRLGLVESATSPLDRWSPGHWPRILATLRHETAVAETAGIDLAVWPEAAYPYPLRHDTRAMPRGQREILGGAIDGPVLFGFIASAPPDLDPKGVPIQDTYNSATIVRRDRSLALPADKVELLSFGEAVPFGEAIPWLRRQFQRSGGLRPGRALRALELEREGAATVRFGVLNCFEDTLPAHGRRISNELAPHLLVNVTNDAWFVGTAAPELHLRLASLRAIELRRDLVRAVNLGPSAWIDASGRLRAVRRTAEPGHLVVTPALHDGPSTTYASLGDAPTWLILAVGCLASWCRARYRPRRET
jgi:apolipoprotein N-acyltransferase